MKSAAASRQRRLKLQTAYGNALIAARGYQAADTTAAFLRARELAAGVEDLSERFQVYYGQWAGSFVRADLMPMREIAQIMLRDCRNRPNSPEAGIAHRLSGETHWFAGTLVKRAPTSNGRLPYSILSVTANWPSASARTW